MWTAFLIGLLLALAFRKPRTPPPCPNCGAHAEPAMRKRLVRVVPWRRFLTTPVRELYGRQWRES